MKKYAASIISFLAIPVLALAQIQNPLKGVGSVSAFVSSIMTYVVRIGGIVVIFFFIYSGFLFVKARGSDKELGAAKTVFKNTVIGAFLILGAQLIASIVVNTVQSIGR